MSPSSPQLAAINLADELLMHRCLDLAKKALGKTSPNPLVGAVVLKEGKIVGEGFHPEAGQPHAEVFALGEAGEQAAGSTVYVNLEPCNHYGRTPPCTEALIKAGVKKVVVGMVDPDPRVQGGGIDRLRQAGIEVVTGIAEAACQELNEAFCHRIRHQLPFGIFKYAMTLDGKIATSNGHSSWVTGAAARQRVHHLRAGCDAVIVGGNTLRHDNPHLTTHGVADHNPLRGVMSRSLDLPDSAHLWDTSLAKTLVLTEAGTNPQLRSLLLAQGVEIIDLAPLNPLTAMTYLYERGCSAVLWECGGNLGAEAIATGVIQKIWAFIAPKIVGGSGNYSPVGEMGLVAMTQALPVERVTMEVIDRDILLQGYLTNIRLWNGAS